MTQTVLPVLISVMTATFIESLSLEQVISKVKAQCSAALMLHVELNNRAFILKSRDFGCKLESAQQHKLSSGFAERIWIFVPPQHATQLQFMSLCHICYIYKLSLMLSNYLPHHPFCLFSLSPSLLLAGRHHQSTEMNWSVFYHCFLYSACLTQSAFLKHTVPLSNTQSAVDES